MNIDTLRSKSPLASSTMLQLTKRLGRQWKVGTRLPGVREMANQLNIAPGTLMLALRDLKEKGILEAKPRVGTFVSNRYTNNELRALAERMQMQSGSHTASPLEGLQVELAYVHGGEELVKRMVSAVKNDLIDRGAVIAEHQHLTMQSSGPIEPTNPNTRALIVFNPNSNRTIRCNSKQTLLVINSGAICHVETTGRYDIVTVDQQQGARLAAQHLSKTNCSRVCFMGVADLVKGDQISKQFDITSDARLSGFRAGWNRGDIIPIHTYAYRFTAGAKAVRTFIELNPKPDAVFAASDELALGFLFAALGAGLRAGTDFNLIGFDGQSLGQHLPETPLTTIAIPAEEMGRRGVQLLASRIADADQPVRNLALGCDIITGSTAPLS